MVAELQDPDAAVVEPPHPRLGRSPLFDTTDESAGRLSLQGRVQADDTIGLFDDIVGGGWQLIGIGVDPLGDVPPEIARWFESIGGTSSTVSATDPLRDVDGSYRTWFDAHGCSVVLSRPDFYVFGTGDQRDVTRLLQSLRDALGAERSTSRRLIEEGARP